MATNKEIAKEILVAILESKILDYPVREHLNDDVVASENEKRVRQIANFYKIILEAVEADSGGKGDHPRPLTV